MLTQRFDDALVFASRLHRTQRRKGSDAPYISHLLAVAALVMEHGEDEDQVIAALLHDAVEDQGGEATLREIRGRYGEEVARIVADCSDSIAEPKPPWRERKEDYIASLALKPRRSLLVSAADKTHNAESIVADHCEIGDALWYYSELARAFETHLPCALTDRLRRAVDAMHR